MGVRVYFGFSSFPKRLIHFFLYFFFLGVLEVKHLTKKHYAGRGHLMPNVVSEMYVVVFNGCLVVKVLLNVSLMM